jgi:hypothetical protein
MATHPTIHSISKGTHYNGRASDGPGCVLRAAHADGVRFATDEGDVVFSWRQIDALRPKVRGRCKTKEVTP